MTIHHDKLAYGKLASNMEELSEERIAEMLKQLCQDGEENAEKAKTENSEKEEE